MPRKPKPTEKAKPSPSPDKRDPSAKQGRLVLEKTGIVEVVQGALDMKAFDQPGVFRREEWLEGMRLVGPYDVLASDENPDLALELTAQDILRRDWKLFTKTPRTTVPGGGSPDAEVDAASSSDLMKSAIEKLESASDNLGSSDDDDEHGPGGSA